jgi:acyl-CoA synthetase (AMP-forming)/AMP-acid ligase II
VNLLTILDMAASAFGDRQAIGHRGEGPTYAELRHQAAVGGAYLSTEAPATIFVGPSGYPFVSAFFASNWADVPFVPLNYRLAVDQLHQLIDRVGDALIICDATFEAELTRPGRKVITTDQWCSLLDREADGEEEGEIADPEHSAVELFTSGTTAEPKAAVLEHRHLAAYILGSVEFAGADETEAALVSVPPYHIAGVANLLSNVFAGRRIIYLSTFQPAEWLETVRREGVTQAMVVPTMLARIVEELAGAESADVPLLRTISYGGARMPLSVLERALELFPGTGFVNAYGLTETSSSIAVLGPDDHRLALESDDEAARVRLSSVGRPLPGIEVEIRDESGPLPTNAHGEIWVRGEQVSGSYKGTASPCDAEGWFPTRDAGWIDEEGYLFVEGRADDTIIRGGENIAPAEIEEVLLRHPAVLDVAVVGLPNEEWGQIIAAAIVLRPGHDVHPNELTDWSRQHLRTSKAAERVVIRESLPRTETGKLIRRHVLAEFLKESE